MANQETAHRPAPGSIVVGIDGSDGSDRALAWAVDQARLERRPVTLVHAVDLRMTQWSGETAFDISTVLTVMAAEGSTELAEAREAVGSDVVVDTVLRRGDPRETLLDLSREASLVVLGSRGRGPVKSLLLGSVSVGVSQHATCPVVVVRPKRAQSPGAGRTASNPPVIVGLRTGRPLTHAIEFAFGQASLRSAPLTVVHGQWEEMYGYLGPAVVAVPLGTTDVETVSVASLLTDLCAKFPDVVVTYEPAHGLPDTCLLDAAEAGCSLLVVGTDHPGLGATLLEGDVARAVTEHATCPVAVVSES